MTTPRQHALLLTALLAFAAVSFGTGLGWGLPSRDADPFLFGTRAPWTGAQVMALAGPWTPDGDRGADLPQRGPATRATVLNATDADRAEIVRRYRLYSNQPDEMITFRSLSHMRPAHGDLDPRLYQYGGLWVYPVGGLLRLASAAGLLTLRTNLAFYLDRPAAFARFYVVARLYSAGWGLVGVVVVYGLARELTGRSLAGATAAAVYAAMPVAVNAAHEAKPHLAGTVLVLATVWAAARHVRAGRGWATAGVLAGCAAGMVLTGAVAVVVLPVMAWLSPARRARTAVAACLLALLTFAVTNPYVGYNAVFHHERLASNLGNTGGMYRAAASPGAVANAARLVADGTSPVPTIVALLGAITCVAWPARFSGHGELSTPRRTPAWLLVAPTTCVAVQFTLLATHKPAEYARFALTLDVAVAVLAAAAITRLPLKLREARLACLLLVAATALYGLRYDLNFLADNRPTSTRRATARTLANLATPGRPLVVTADPAPYGLPPIDLFTWRLILAPVHAGANAIEVRPTDAGTTGISSPISWANKPFVVRGVSPPASGRPQGTLVHGRSGSLRDSY